MPIVAEPAAPSEDTLENIIEQPKPAEEQPADKVVGAQQVDITVQV